MIIGVNKFHSFDQSLVKLSKLKLNEKIKTMINDTIDLNDKYR